MLIVEDDAAACERYGEWLESSGYSVTNCPGPTMAGHACLGVQGAACPLGHAADLVLIDSRRLPGVSRKGYPGWKLLHYYLKAGKPVVVIADRARPDRSFRPEQVAVVHGEPGRESLLLATRRMLNEAARW
ncbi:MAG TPA: response regulator [Candidatus Dormibacteraeota bacterium]